MKIWEEKTRRRRKKYKRQVQVIERRNLFFFSKESWIFPLSFFHPLSSTDNDDPITVERDYYSFSSERRERDREKRDDDQHKIAWRALYSWKRKKSFKRLFSQVTFIYETERVRGRKWVENLHPFSSTSLSLTQTLLKHFVIIFSPFSSKVDHLIMIMIVYWNQFNKQEKWGGGGKIFSRRRVVRIRFEWEGSEREKEKNPLIVSWKIIPVFFCFCHLFCSHSPFDVNTV